MGLLLLLITVIMSPIKVLGFGWAVIHLLVIGTFVHGYKTAWNMFDGYCRGTAIADDQKGNAAMWPMFNTIMIKKGGYLFGNPDETISSVFGKNQLAGTLTGFGRFIGVTVLNKIEKDHSINSIDHTENEL